MPIDVYCATCQKKLRVPDTAAGKRIKCPKCQGVLSVPAAGATPAAGAAAIATPAKATASASGAVPVIKPTLPVKAKSGIRKTPTQPVEQWHVQTEDGQQYGPVSRQELDQWHGEGRLSSETQILRDGGEQWQWASDLYPDLTPETTTPATATPTAAPATPGIPDFGAIAAASEEAPKSGGSGPFDFAANAGAPATTPSVASRVKKGSGKKRAGKPKGGSPHIDYIAYTLYTLGGINILVFLVILIMGMSSASSISTIPIDASNPERVAQLSEASSMVATITAVVSVVGILMSCVYLAAGYGLQQRASWGRITAIVIGVLSLPGIPFGTALGIWIWIVLSDAENKKAFA